ncbi:MAG: 50S ribosomal protein L25 [Candidatus Shapirobacteria bacterium]|nr:50S ribosomal protein L25 [Candidatus Shapirobacteria bacterium]
MAKTNPKLEAQVRTVLGRKVKKLRREGLIPATIYGHKFDSVSVQVDGKSLNKLFTQVGESGLVDLVVGENTYPIIFRNPQYHPVWGDLIHIDCYKVNLKEKIRATVPIEFVGESLAVKEGNILVPVTEEIEVEALPTDLPEKIVVDLSVLETLESVVTVADLKLDKDVVEIKTALDQVVIKVEEPKVEEEPVVAPTEPVEVPATEQKTEEEKTADEAVKKIEKEKEKE